jgi:hypothetical protein
VTGNLLMKKKTQKETGLQVDNIMVQTSIIALGENATEKQQFDLIFLGKTFIIV